MIGRSVSRLPALGVRSPGLPLLKRCLRFVFAVVALASPSSGSTCKPKLPAEYDYNVSPKCPTKFCDPLTTANRKPIGPGCENSPPEAFLCKDEPSHGGTYVGPCCKDAVPDAMKIPATPWNYIDTAEPCPCGLKSSPPLMSVQTKGTRKRIKYEPLLPANPGITTSGQLCKVTEEEDDDISCADHFPERVKPCTDDDCNLLDDQDVWDIIKDCPRGCAGYGKTGTRRRFLQGHIRDERPCSKNKDDDFSCAEYYNLEDCFCALRMKNETAEDEKHNWDYETACPTEGGESGAAASLLQKPAGSVNIASDSAQGASSSKADTSTVTVEVDETGVADTEAQTFNEKKRCSFVKIVRRRRKYLVPLESLSSTENEDRDRTCYNPWLDGYRCPINATDEGEECLIHCELRDGPTDPWDYGEEGECPCNCTGYGMSRTRKRFVRTELGEGQECNNNPPETIQCAEEFGLQPCSAGASSRSLQQRNDYNNVREEVVTEEDKVLGLPLPAFLGVVGGVLALVALTVAIIICWCNGGCGGGTAEGGAAGFGTAGGGRGARPPAPRMQW